LCDQKNPRLFQDFPGLSKHFSRKLKKVDMRTVARVYVISVGDDISEEFVINDGIIAPLLQLKSKHCA